MKSKICGIMGKNVRYDDFTPIFTIIYGCRSIHIDFSADTNSGACALTSVYIDGPRGVQVALQSAQHVHLFAVIVLQFTPFVAEYNLL